MATAIGTLGNVDRLTVGGYDFANPANSGLIILGAYTSSNQYSGFRLASATSGGYQVPAGKTLYIWAIDINATSTNNTMAVGWGTAAITFNAAAPPAGAAYPYGDIGAAQVLFLNTGDTRASMTLPYQVPQNMYPFIQTNANSGVMRIYGYLV